MKKMKTHNTNWKMNGGSPSHGFPVRRNKIKEMMKMKKMKSPVWQNEGNEKMNGTADMKNEENEENGENGKWRNEEKGKSVKWINEENEEN